MTVIPMVFKKGNSVGQSPLLCACSATRGDPPDSWSVRIRSTNPQNHNFGVHSLPLPALTLPPTFSVIYVSLAFDNLARMSSSYANPSQHDLMNQQGSSLQYATQNTSHLGAHPSSRRTSLGGHSYIPYPVSPHSPSCPPEAPLTSDEIFLWTSAFPYMCSCGEVFRGRSHIGAHIQLNPSHWDLFPGNNLRPCVRNCGRMIDDLEDLVDHLERRHSIQQDIRGIFAPFVHFHTYFRRSCADPRLDDSSTGLGLSQRQFRIHLPSPLLPLP